MWGKGGKREEGRRPRLPAGESDLGPYRSAGRRDPRRGCVGARRDGADSEIGRCDGRRRRRAVGGSGEGEANQATEDVGGAPVVASVASGKGGGGEEREGEEGERPGKGDGETTRTGEEEEEEAKEGEENRWGIPRARQRENGTRRTANIRKGITRARGGRESVAGTEPRVTTPNKTQKTHRTVTPTPSLLSPIQKQRNQHEPTDKRKAKSGQQNEERDEKKKRER